MKKYSWGLWALLFLGITACRKKELPEPVKTPVITPAGNGSLKIKLNNVVGATRLSLGGLVWYSLPNGDIFKVSLYNYYLTNFVFTDDKGNQFAEKESYHLIMADKPESLEFEVKNMPSANYRSVEFLIGVDSVHNVSGVQAGDLSPKYGMLWSWSTGYIMAKMEGTVIASGKMLAYHISGFKGPNNAIQKIKLDLPAPALVSENKIPVLNLQSDLATWFAAPNFSNFATLPVVGDEGPDALKIAQNYRSMMSIVSVENP